MRSVKQVKRAHRIRSLKNAAACKRNAYRRKMQAKHNWQTNTVFTGFRLPTLNAPTPAPRKTKEPKQRTAEEIAERQRAREQKRLEKELAKQKASTSALPKPKKIKKEKRLIEESVEKKAVQPKQQTSKKEKIKIEAEEVDEKRPRVEPEKRKGTDKESKNDTKEISVKIAKAEKKEPKIPTKELEAEKREPNAEIKERKAKQPAPPESEADSKEKKSKQRAPRESDADTKEKKAKQRAPPEPDADTKERTKQRAPPEPEADTKEKKAKQRAPPEPDADTKEKKAKQRAPPEPDADTKERTKQRAPPEPDADTKEKETKHSAPPESGADTKERKAKQSAPPESVPIKTKKKGKKGAEIPMAQQHPVIEEVQLKKAEDAAPFSSAPSEHQHVDEHMMKGVHDDEKGIEAPTALESTEVAEHPKENVVDEKKGDEVADGSVVVDAAKKGTISDGSSPIAEEDGLPLNDAPAARDDFKPAEEMPSFIHDSSKHGQIVSEEMPAVEEPTLEEQHQTLAAEINRASLDEKREDEQHNEPLEYDEHIGDSKSKKQRKHKGHHPESERHDEFQQRDEHAQAVDEATKEVAGDTSKKHKKKRNRKSETEHHMPSPDEVQFVEGESIENDADQVEGGEFTAVISRRHKKKGRSPELENAHEETHTTEPLRELYENVEEMRGENGKSVDAKTIPPAATIEASKEIVEEVIPPPTVLQRCPCEGPNKEQHTHKTTEVITIGDVPSDDQVVVDKTVTTLDAAGSPNQFAQNVGKLAEEHPELMKNANIELGEHVTGNVTITTFTTKTAVTQEPVKVAKRDPIVLALERDKRADLRQRRERVYKLLPRDVEFCTRMIEAHGNDYEAMAKDPTNVHQETAKSIQRKIRIFRESPQYETYVRSKNSSPVPPPVKG